MRALAFRAFYGMPASWRRRLVRLGTPTYVLGALVLVHAADAPAPGRLLLVRQPPGTGWSLPGGLLNRTERPSVGAARELAEETGIVVDASDLRRAVPNAVVHTDGRWVDLVYEADVASDTPIAVDRAEILEAAWHPIDNLPPVTRATGRLLAHYGIGPYADYPETTA
jgi:ADP-ribose pyrophosphatase YjhB (NUDIX family)